MPNRKPKDDGVVHEPDSFPTLLENLNAGIDLENADMDTLLAHQQALTEHRLHVLECQRLVQAQVDARAAEAEERRIAESGQETHPPTQDVFGDEGPAPLGAPQLLVED